MGKFLETKFAQQNVKIAKRRPTNVGRNLPRRIKRDHSNVQCMESPTSDYQYLRFQVGTNPISGRKCLKLINSDCDLFADDDLRASYGQFTNHNLLFLVFDEVALEGLDGITLQALWKRIETVLKFQIVCHGLKEAIWQLVCLNDRIRLFELPEERPNLVLDWSDPTDDSNLFSDPRNTGNELYKVDINSKEFGQWGSCSTLKERVDISETARQMSLSEVITKYKNKLVLVADFDLRKSILVEDISDPNYELMPVEYCLLERIGRARKMGEMTAGATALSTCFGFDQKSTYHYCKKLRKQNLVIRQHCFFAVNTEQTRMGRLMQLRRFYRKKKSKYLIMTEKVVNYLKKCTNHEATYASVRALFEPGMPGKLFKHAEFLKYINIKNVLYKDYFEGSTYKEYMTKSLSKEREVQLAKLKDPYVNVEASWVDHQNAESSDDDDDDDDEEGKKGPSKNRRIFNKDFIKDVYQYILSKGSSGVCASDLNEVFDNDFATMRTVLKKLSIRKLVTARRFDHGRKTMNKFTATRLVKTEIDSEAPILVQTSTSSVLNKLKQRQKQKIDSLPPGRVYTMTQLEGERCQTHTLPPLIFSQPLVQCEFFTLFSKRLIFSHVMNSEVNVFIVRFRQVLTPFKINVTCPKISMVVSTDCMENRLLNMTQLKDCQAELCLKKWKPDYIMKAYLLKALIDNVKLNDKELIEFLDPNKPTRKVEKRSLETSDEKVNTDVRVVLGMFMGTNPSLLQIEKDTQTGIVVEVYVSIPIDQYKTGDITQYSPDPSSTALTERALSRIAFILKSVQRDQIFNEVNRFLQLIHQHESETGYDNKIDRKSLHKICKKLADEGYFKAFTVYVTNGAVKKSQTFLCHPEVTFEHHMMQENLQQLKEKVYCDVNKTIKKPVAQPKALKSPFAQDDVVNSLKQIKELIPLDTVKPSRTSAKCYGLRPKFARLALMHELLYYLVFEENGSRPLSKAAANDLLQANQINLSDSELETVPPMYCKEISWKTFIRPMPKHFGWEKGWCLLGDIVMRFPLLLITRCYSVNFYSNELQVLLQHPIKRFYTLQNIPVNVRTLILYKRKFIYDMIHHLYLLCYCGLVQLGPSSSHEKEKLFFYLNRKATLWDTTSIKPGYMKIEGKDYPKIRFEFRAMEDVLKYWSTMNSICLHTHLAIKSIGQEKTNVKISSKSKPSLVKARTARTKANVKEFDTGDIPGDNLGAAGLDSSLWSHLPRGWHFFATKTDNTVPESLNCLKLDKIDTRKYVNKFQLIRPRVATKSSKQKKVKKASPVKPANRRKIKKALKSSMFDAVDRAVVKKFGGVRYRPRWTQEEDKLLILLKIAIFFLTPGPINKRIGYGALRDVLYIKSTKSRDKTSRNVSNRFKLLSKTVRFLSNLENLIPNLYKLSPIAKYFVPLKRFLLHGEDRSGMNREFKISDQELRVAFVFLAHYILNHQKEVEVAIHGKYTSIDYFSKENYEFYAPRIVSCEKKKQFYFRPTSDDDITRATLTCTIQSSLSHKSSKPEWSVQSYKVFQQFPQELLKTTLITMKEQRMLQFRREHRKSFFTPYRLSLNFVFAQSASFSYHTMDEAFVAYLKLKSHSFQAGRSHETVQENYYGQMFALNEVLSLSGCKTKMEFKFPEHHFVLNPNLDDHSEVIEELAKRYQAKLKSELKDAEATTERQSSGKPEDDDEDEGEPEVFEPTPGPSVDQPGPIDIEVMAFEDDEPMDLTITANDSATIDNLKHWISDCIDLERVRSPSPELFNLPIQQEEQTAENAVEESASPADKVLSLEEIKEEMLKPFDCNEKRLVPHISDLTKLLSTTFEDLETDDRASCLMKKHFVQKYPTLQSFEADGLESLDKVLEQKACIKDRVEKVSGHVGPPTDQAKFADILNARGLLDVNKTREVLSYIENKHAYGATGFDLKLAFPNEPLDQILKALVEHHYVLRTGICDVTFVHYKHQNPWLTNTYRLDEEDVKNDQFSPISVSAPDWIKIKALPWTAIDGTLDRKMLKIWLSQVFSYCLENPKIPMQHVCRKFCYFKPVDVFYLVELLEEIGALEIRRMTSQIDLFSEYTEVEDCKASFLDSFDDIYVDTKSIGFISVGSCFHTLE